MAATLPTIAPPAELAARALPYLSARVAAAAPSGPDVLVPALEISLRTLARARLLSPTPVETVPLAPLHALVSLADSDPAAVSAQLLADALLAYPAEVGELAPAVMAVLSVPGREDEVRAMVDGASGALASPSPPAMLATTRLLHALVRLPASAGLVHSRAAVLVPILCKAYDALTTSSSSSLSSDETSAAVRAKAETLTLLRALIAHSPPLRSALPPRKAGTPLLDANVTADYDLFGTARPRADQAAAVRALHDDERRDDPRLPPLVALFPTLPLHLLADALAHPRFSGGTSRASAEEQAAPLVDAILARSLPAELAELRAAVAAMDGAASPQAETPEPNASAESAPAADRRGVWDAADLARLRIKDKSGGTLGADIPDNLRASILRLVEAQAEEADAAERAVAEARGMWGAGDDDDDEDEDDRGVRGPRVRDADDSDDDDGEGDGDGDGNEGKERTPARSAHAKAQTLLELAYLRDPSVFGRDAATRRGAARADLRDKTGMDDGQIEGWRIMLERNPHKDAILERHRFSREASAPKAKKEGGGGGGGAGGRGASGGSGGGGRGGRGGGAGRGRGGNKGSRGHANAKRTGGHDKKMSRMGAGL